MDFLVRIKCFFPEIHVNTQRICKSSDEGLRGKIKRFRRQRQLERRNLSFQLAIRTAIWFFKTVYQMMQMKQSRSASDSAPLLNIYVNETSGRKHNVEVQTCFFTKRLR